MSTLLCLLSEELQKYWRYTKKLLVHDCVLRHTEYIYYTLANLASLTGKLKNNNNKGCEVPQYLGDLPGNEMDSSSYENLK